MIGRYFLSGCFILFFMFTSVGQTDTSPQFNFDDYGFPKSIVNEINGMRASEIKSQTQSWIDSFFSEEQILNLNTLETSIELTAKAYRLISIKNLTTDIKFKLKISFRDNKYRLEISSLYYKYYTEYIEVSNIKFIKDELIRKDLEESESSFETYFNDMNTDLNKYIRSQDSSW